MIIISIFNLDLPFYIYNNNHSFINNFLGASDGHYRILTRPPFQRVVATAENKDKILEFIHLAHIEILPRVKGLSMELFHSLLPSLLEKLAHQTTLSLLREW